MIDMRPPDLQELVARFGGYDTEAWAEYDRAMAEWQIKRREALTRERADFLKRTKEGGAP
jgi:hypothetical protein